MAEGQQQQRDENHAVSGRSIVWASLAAMAVTAPLLGMMGFSFLATLTLLIVSSPLLLIFSPLLLFVGLVFAGALVGFAVAAAMALAGISALAWMYREFGGCLAGSCSVAERLAKLGQRVKQQGKSWAEYLQQNMPENSLDAMAKTR